MQLHRSKPRLNLFPFFDLRLHFTFIVQTLFFDLPLPVLSTVTVLPEPSITGNTGPAMVLSFHGCHKDATAMSHVN